MSEAASIEDNSNRLEEAKNIALGWRIVGNIEPHTLEDAIQMLRDSAAHAQKVYELLYAEMAQRVK